MRYEGNEVLQVQLIEKEVISIELNTIDLISVRSRLSGLVDVDLNNPQDGEVLTYNLTDKVWENKSLGVIVGDSHILNETPTQLTVRQFQTSKNYESGTLRVFLNGIKQKNIVEDSSNTFSLVDDTVLGDIIEVNYIEQ